MGRIKLNRMRFHTCHGALPHEQHVAQEFWVDVTLELDLTNAGMSDRLADTVHYGRVASVVEEIMMGPPVKLLETLAHRIHRSVRELDHRIGWLEVRVTKVDPPIGVPSGGVEVVVEDGG
ncbi:MAG: dihydroneopterin aldolase [Thermaerobacter sp.]|nr:dihydroneopterin aldolase [Thermaerobacter sp.]